MCTEVCGCTSVRYSGAVTEYTVEPPNHGCIRDKHFVHCSEVVPSSEVEIYGQHRQGANRVSIVGRLSTLQSVHYQRFHCTCDQLFCTNKVGQ